MTDSSEVPMKNIQQRDLLWDDQYGGNKIDARNYLIKGTYVICKQ